MSALAVSNPAKWKELFNSGEMLTVRRLVSGQASFCIKKQIAQGRGTPWEEAIERFFKSQRNSERMDREICHMV